jgi:ADP-ribosylglycohydrolase
VTRALVAYRRASKGVDWTPVAVFLATADHLEGRALPGPAREAWLADQLARSEPPVVDTGAARVRGTWEDWVTWALDELANAYFTMAAEVAPTATIDQLYQREILDFIATTLAPQAAPIAAAMPADPVDTTGGVELVELREGVLLSIDRETDERLYGTWMSQDGEPAGLWATQTTFPKSAVLRRTPLSIERRPLRDAGGRTLKFAGYLGWALGDSRYPENPVAATIADGYPVPSLAWPEPVSERRNLWTLRDRMAGALVGCAIGDGLGGQVDGLSASTTRAAIGPRGVRDLPRTGAQWSDATATTVEVARSLAASGGRFDGADFTRRLTALTPTGHGGGPVLGSAIVALAGGQPWYTVGLRLAASDHGAAVRAGPVGLVHAGETSASGLLREAVLFALPTHGGALGVAGAVAMAAAVGYLVRIASTGSTELEPDVFLDFVARAIAQLEVEPTPTRRPPVRVIYLRDRIRRIESWLARPPGTVFERIWTGPPALESVPAAFFCFLRKPDRADEALLTAANATHETAAIGAMTGLLAGAWLGAERLQDQIPGWWASVARRSELLDLADRLMDKSADLAEAEEPPLTPLG